MKKNFGILLAVCFLVFGLPFTALAEEGVTDTTIRIGQWGPQTGPAALGEAWRAEQESSFK